MVHVEYVAGLDYMGAARRRAREVGEVLDIGPGIRPQDLLLNFTRQVCVEPFAPYIDRAKAQLAGDGRYEWRQGQWEDALDWFPPQSFDTVILLDVVEHCPKARALEWLARTTALARQQVIIFTPYGFMPQYHPDGRDAWGMEGGVWQEHHSGWYPEDFGDNWHVIVLPDFHAADNVGRPLPKPQGAMWAVWDRPSDGAQ